MEINAIYIDIENTLARNARWSSILSIILDILVSLIY